MRFDWDWQIYAFWLALAWVLMFTSFMGGVFWGVRLWARSRTRADTKFHWDAIEKPSRRDIWRALVWYLFIDGKEKGKKEVIG